jgi:hypothetical protein
MADPCAKAIMIGGIDDGNLGTDLLRTVDEFTTQPGMNVLAG